MQSIHGSRRFWSNLITMKWSARFRFVVWNVLVVCDSRDWFNKVDLFYFLYFLFSGSVWLLENCIVVVLFHRCQFSMALGFNCGVSLHWIDDLEIIVNYWQFILLDRKFFLFYAIFTIVVNCLCVIRQVTYLMLQHRTIAERLQLIRCGVILRAASLRHIGCIAWYLAISPHFFLRILFIC